MKKIHKLTTLIISLIMIITTSSPFTFAKELSDPSWTILIYLCGSDLESEGGFATTDIEEILDSTASSNVTVIIETGGSYGWDNNYVDEEAIDRYGFSDGEFELIDSVDLSSMGESDTLTDFITWSVENYPADNMGLVFWNHGGGSISGVCFDELFDQNSLTLKEIESSLEKTSSLLPSGFEFIGFDACLMATLENAAVLSPYAGYMFASEETEPGTGWNYSAILSYLAENPDSKGEELGKILCESYYEACDASNDSAGVTFSIIDLAKIPALTEAFDQTMKEVYASDNIPEFARSALKADNFGGNNRSEGYTNMVDMADVLRNISDFAPSALNALQALEDCVVSKVNGTLHKNSGGLSMYYPLSIQGTEEIPVFNEICPSTYYLAIVSSLAEGADLSQSDQIFTSVDESDSLNISDIYIDEYGTYTVELEDMDYFAYASCLFFLMDDEGGYIYLGEDDDVIIDYDEYMITDNFDGTWLCYEDTLLPIELIAQNDEISLYSISILLNEEETNLRVMYDWDEGEFYVLGTWDGIDPSSSYAARESGTLSRGDVINIIYTYIDADGEEDYFLSDDIIYDGNFEIFYDNLPDGEYDYSICLYDIYGNYYTLDSTTFAVEDGETYFYEN